MVELESNNLDRKIIWLKIQGIFFINRYDDKRKICEFVVLTLMTTLKWQNRFCSLKFWIAQAVSISNTHTHTHTHTHTQIYIYVTSYIYICVTSFPWGDFGKYLYIYIYIFTNIYSREGCDTKGPYLSKNKSERKYVTGIRTRLLRCRRATR